MRRTATLLGVALVSLCVLMLQLTLTRLFSATMYYHFAFLAISLALFGPGAAGVAVFLLGERLDAAHRPGALALCASLFALGTLLALGVVLASPLSPADPAATTFGRLARVYGATALPFFFAGAALTLAVKAYAREMGRLYLFDLAGAAAGCLLLIPLLDRLGAVDTVLLSAALAALAGALFEWARPGGRPRAALALAALLGALCAANHFARVLDVRRAKGLRESGHVIFSKWNSFSRVTVWGSLAHDRVLIMIDADAATLLSRDGRDLARHAALGRGVEALAYRLKRAPRALVLGSGGGNDVIAARLLGAREVVAVEVNPIVARDIVSAEPFLGYSGGLFAQPGVRLVVDEGRSFLRSSRERYDLIQGTMVDTWAATAAGAYSLTENNLYTVEAFRDFAAHLEPDGILSLTRWHLEPPDQLLRLFSLARALMDEQAVADPAWHLLLVRGRPEPGGTRAAATFLFKKSAFSAAEVEQAEAAASGAGFTILYTPLTRPDNGFTRIAEAPDLGRTLAEFPGDLSPSRDDRPFFFHTTRLRELGKALAAPEEWRKTNLGTFVLAALLLLTTLATAAFILGPMALARGRLPSRFPTASWLLYFACLGAGFILVEVVLVQKFLLFLGYPVYALAVVLFSLLLASAAGSGLSSRIPEASAGRALPRILSLAALLIGLAALGLSPVFDAFATLSRPGRIGIAVALLLPLGLVMGMPMPTGIRLLAARQAPLVPWAWGVNGAASVLGSVAALSLALAFGFQATLLAGAGLYLGGIACLARAGAAAR
jgi:predicted membrane-bound spermidine synthase